MKETPLEAALRQRDEAITDALALVATAALEMQHILAENTRLVAMRNGARAEVEQLRSALVFWKFCAERQIAAVQSITALPYLGYAQERADAALAARAENEVNERAP